MTIFARKDEEVNTKLTLSLDDAVIEKAKQYATAHKISLSKLVERYFDSLQNVSEMEISPLVRELTGIAQDVGNEREVYRKHLEEKHG